MRFWILKEIFLAKRTGEQRDFPSSLAQTLIAAANSNSDKLLLELESHDDGLSESEAEYVRGHAGLNEIEHDKPLQWWLHLWYCYKNPFNLLLTVLAAISYYTEDMKATIVISTMVIISTLLRFVQETRSNKAADQLREMVSNAATVMRRDPSENAAEDALKYFGVLIHTKEAKSLEVPIKLLVPGDVVLLSAGDMIPADVRILSCKDLFVSQAAMTGEALPVEKFSTNKHESTTNPIELENQCGQRHCPGRGGHHGQPHLFRRAGGKSDCDGSGSHRLSGWREQGELADDALHADHDADRAADQRIHQGQLAGSFPIRRVHCNWTDSRNAADDRNHNLGKRSSIPVAQKSHC
jgi:magnesium-transporting ATPase (P-type)